MPIEKTYRDTSLVGAVEFIPGAATAEAMTEADVEALWIGLSEATRNGLISYAQTVDATLAEWKAAWPTDLGSLTDEQASALIRVAVGMAGGAATDAVKVEEPA